MPAGQCGNRPCTTRHRRGLAVSGVVRDTAYGRILGWRQSDGLALLGYDSPSTANTVATSWPGSTDAARQATPISPARGAVTSATGPVLRSRTVASNWPAC